MIVVFVYLCFNQYPITMRSVVCLLLMLLFTIDNSAQNYEWTQHIGGTHSNYFNDCTIDGEGNLYICGKLDDASPTIINHFPYLTPDYGNYLLKYDSIGELIWINQMEFSHPFGEIVSLQADADGNIYLLASLLNDASYEGQHFSSTDEDILLLKLNTDGDLLWHKQFGGMGNQEAEDLVLANNLLYHFGCFEDSISADSFALIQPGMSDCYLSCLDTAGNFLWIKHYGDSALENGIFHNTVIDSQGHIYMAGQLSRQLTLGDTTLYSILDTNGFPSSDGFIAKYDSDGAFLWANQAGGPRHNEWATGITLDSHNNVYITGRMDSGAVFDSILLEVDYYSGYLAKLDPNGDFIWARELFEQQTPQSFTKTSTHLSTNAFDQVLLAGQIGPYHPDSTMLWYFGNDTIPTLGGRDAFVAKYDSNGTELWASNCGSQNTDIAHRVLVHEDDLILVGIWGSNSSTPTGGTSIGYFGEEVFVLHGVPFMNDSIVNFDVFFSRIKDLDSIHHPPPVIDQLEVLNTHQFLLYPNPSTGAFTLDLGAIQDKVSIELTDITGKRLMYKEATHTRRLEFQTNVVPGLYFLQVNTPDAQASLKLLIRR